MTTRFSAVRAAIATVLLANAGALGADVYNGRIDAFSVDELPAINIMPGAYDQSDGGLDFNTWRFDVTIEVCTHGATAYAVADAIVAQIMPLLVNAASIKLLAYNIQHTGARAPEVAGADFEYQSQTLSFSFDCQTALDNLT